MVSYAIKAKTNIALVFVVQQQRVVKTTTLVFHKREHGVINGNCVRKEQGENERKKY